MSRGKDAFDSILRVEFPSWGLVPIAILVPKSFPVSSEVSPLPSTNQEKCFA